jgi:large subunit ribosomal protein L35
MAKKPTVGKYKIKTHSGAKGRFYITGSGKILRRKCNVNNFRRKKRGETLRQLPDKMSVSDGFAKRLRRLMPYI